MTITGTSSIALTGTAAAITTNGKTIPNLLINGNKTLNDTLNVVNITFNTAVALSSNTVNCSGNWNSGFNAITGTAIINLVGTGTVTFGSFGGSNGLNLNTSGTLSGSTIGIGLAANSVLNYSAGTLSQMRLKLVGQPITINGNGVEFESFDDTGANAASNTINIPTEFKVKYFNATISSAAFNPATNNQITFSGVGALNITDSMNLDNAIINATGVIQYKPYNIAFNTGVTHSINVLNINGFNAITSNTTLSAAYANLRSASSGNRANINLLSPSTSIISNTNVTDINFTNPVYKVAGGSISNSVNITSVSIGASGSTVSGGAWTFVN
jgi:hypothetical protein